jgi:hypothetical protein
MKGDETSNWEDCRFAYEGSKFIKHKDSYKKDGQDITEEDFIKAKNDFFFGTFQTVINLFGESGDKTYQQLCLTSFAQLEADLV